MASEVRKLSEPARRMAALPALRQSAPASAVTLGRLSKITPMTPSGVATRSIFRPFGRSNAPARARPDRAARQRSRRPRRWLRRRSIRTKAIDERRRSPLVPRIAPGLGVGWQDRLLRADRRRHGGERRVLLLGARQSESVGGQPGPAPQIHHLGPNLIGNARYRGFGVESP